MNRFARHLVTLFIPMMAVTSAWSQPDIEFDTRSYDFGASYPRQHLYHGFSFANKGDQPLVIDRVRSSCGCTATVLSSTTVQPGSESIISVTMSTASPGKMHKTVSVYTNDPKDPMVVLDVIADVRALWSFSPRPNYSFRDVPINSSQSMTLTLANLDGEDFTILGHKTTRPEFKVDFGEVKEGEVPITVMVESGSEKGYLSDTLEIRTDNEKQPLVQASLYAEVVGNVTFNRKRLYFGSVPANTTVSREVTAQCSQAGGKPLEITKIESDYEQLSGKVLGPSADGGVRVEITFTAPAKPGYHTGEVKLHTNLEAEPVAVLPYSALIRR